MWGTAEEFAHENIDFQRQRPKDQKCFLAPKIQKCLENPADKWDTCSVLFGPTLSVVAHDH